jgi:hypothetical protein
MNRRTFLGTAGNAAAWTVTCLAFPRLRAVAAAPIDRKSKWAPNATDVVQWRYLAGRITDSGADFGFIVSVSDVKFPNKVQELLVERQDFTGNKAFAAHSYSGTLTYNGTSGTYTFQASQGPASATWQWDDGARMYLLSVTSPELTLSNVVLRPQGDLIPEGGSGTIGVGTVLGFSVASDYHSDWVAIEIGGVPKGVARLDMQGLYPAPLAAVAPAQAGADYDHHWFAIAGETAGTPVWISAWRIETQNGPLWDVTIAQGSSPNWNVSSTTEQNTVVAPPDVCVLAWQPLESVDPTLSDLKTGQRWRITAGKNQPGDLIDLDIAVPPGQFASGARLGATGELSWLEEGVGSTTATGTVLGKPLSNVRLVVAETTAEFYLQQLPLARR